MFEIRQLTEADLKLTELSPEEIMANANEIMAYIKLHFPMIISHLPENMEPFDHRFKKGTGLCSHPALLDTNWLTFNGQKAFSTAELPNEFYCVGIQNRGSSEYFFVLWVKEGRKFWFYDRYVVFIGSGFPDSPERTRERLKEALEEYNHDEKDNTSGNG